MNDLLLVPSEKATVIKESISTEDLVALKTSIIPINASLQLPTIKPGVSRILNCSVNPAPLNWEYSRNKVIIKGLLDLTVVYIGLDDDDHPTEVLANDWNRENDTALPFETSFDLNIPEEGILIVPEVIPMDTRIEIKSHREMRCQINLHCRTSISRILTSDIVTEVNPSTTTIIDTKKNTVNFEEYLGETNGEVPFELTVTIPTGHPGIERLLSYDSLLSSTKSETNETMAIVNANLDLHVLYMAEGADSSRLIMTGWDSNYNNGLSISGMVEFPNLLPGSSLITQNVLESLGIELLNERTLKVNGIIKTRLFAHSPRSITVVEDCAEVIPVNPETRPSMLFYIVQPGDNLWKIARRYQTTMNQLSYSNQIASPDQLAVGQKLLIPKHFANL